MSNQEIAEELVEIIHERIRDLSDLDYCEVLEDIEEQVGSSAKLKREELEGNGLS